MPGQLSNANPEHVAAVPDGSVGDCLRSAALAPLERAILSTVAYRDVFGFPVTLDETHRYLHYVAATRASVAEGLAALQRSSLVVADENYFSLRGREPLFAQRRARLVHARCLWTHAYKYARALATIPTVKMVGVTGSLACDNTTEDADIDFMLVLEPGTLWRTRALTNTVVLMDNRLGGRLCVNYFLTERALGLKCRDLYIAQELAQMVPLYGLETYEALRTANAWVYEILPNARGSPNIRGDVTPFERARRYAGPIMRSRTADFIENWEATRKLRKYNETDFLRGGYTEFTRESTGHQLSVRQNALCLHEERLAYVDSIITRTLSMGSTAVPERSTVSKQPLNAPESAPL